MSGDVGPNVAKVFGNSVPSYSLLYHSESSLTVKTLGFYTTKVTGKQVPCGLLFYFQSNRRIGAWVDRQAVTRFYKIIQILNLCTNCEF